VQIQAIEASELRGRADAQQQEVVTLEPARGEILDRAGQPLAVDEPARTIVAYPKLVRDRLAAAAYVAQQLHRRKAARREAVARYMEAMATPGAVQVTLERQVTTAKAERVLAPEVRGIDAIPEDRRSYPAHSVAAQLLGFTDIDGHGRPNGAGLEYALDEVLSGRPGQEVVVRDAAGARLNTVALRKPVAGKDVRLTIDRAIQGDVQEILAATARRWRARSATAVVLDPRTGEVLALATAPAYDNNDVHELPPKELARRTPLRAVQDQFEPGSTFKVVTMSAALASGRVYPQMRFNDLPPELKVADRTIHDAEDRGPVDLTASQILRHSSNVGTVTIAQIVGRVIIHDWIRRFGFGETTLGLPGETAGIVLAPDDWSGSSIGNIPIGQGIAVTAVQMAQLYATIANGGVRVEPHVIRRIGDGPVTRPEQRRVVPPEANAQLVDMLKGVVSDDGTGTAAAVPGYTVAGKTGTAEKPDGKGGYSDTDYVASFVGFLPADDPRAVVMVAVDSPRGNIYGGAVAAPAFAEIAQMLVRALSIPPDRPARGPR
jgi:cell division protein FtsI (penicillin-binding protein 3)/stage V sporulation protein D (sporulation-specific penicillin-binding protein)